MNSKLLICIACFLFNLFISYEQEKEAGAEECAYLGHFRLFFTQNLMDEYATPCLSLNTIFITKLQQPGLLRWETASTLNGQAYLIIRLWFTELGNSFPWIILPCIGAHVPICSSVNTVLIQNGQLDINGFRAVNRANNRATRRLQRQDPNLNTSSTLPT
jgi:hypothetical protein